MDDSPRLDLERAGPIATIRITNPRRRNAMTIAMWQRLPRLLDSLAADPAVAVVVVSGAGGTFCAGADIAEAATLARAGESSAAVAAEEALAAFGKPTIAQIDGFCVGGGCQLAVACDLRIAAQDSRLGVTAAKLGIVYPAVTTRRLVRLVGPATAKYLLYSAELVDGSRAATLGLVDEAVPAGALTERVRALATTLASRSRLTLAAAKEIVDGCASEERWEYWHREAERSGETDAGVAAFAARREPAFPWRGTV